MGKKSSAKQPPFLNKVRITIATESNPPSFISAESQFLSFCTEHKARSALFFLKKNKEDARSVFFLKKKGGAKRTSFFDEKKRKGRAKRFFL